MAAWLAISIVLACKARIEEQLLLAQFPECAEYRSSTKRFVPFLFLIRSGSGRSKYCVITSTSHDTQPADHCVPSVVPVSQQVIHTSRSLVDRLEVIDDMPLANRAEMLFDLLR